jgi:hypothetical protein
METFMISARGVAIGKEHFGEGVNISISPMMNMGRLGRLRFWPLLSWRLIGAYETILAMQSTGVQACAMTHFIRKRATDMVRLVLFHE